MAAQRPNFADELNPSIRKIFFDRYKEETQMMPMIFNVETSDRDQETDSGTTGFGKMELTDELGALPYEDPIKMFKTTYVHRKYAKGFKVSEELVDDDQHNVIKRLPKALAKSVVKTTEYHAASVFNNGFSTSYTSYGDGKPLFSTSHARSDGGTAQSNASATGLTLSEPNLETGALALETALDDKGEIINHMVDTMLVPIQLRKTAQIITESTKRSGTANNDLNVYEGRFNVMVWRYLTNSTAWFLMDKGEHLINWFWRQRPQFRNDYAFDTDAALYKVKIRFSTGWSDWRGVWGSKGDGAAYSS